ncbi:dockerin type I domain-containing protein [Deinococcus roseus]|uniref:Dockerin domain-containing protein n=1 Tax=Deinococcus roseus TaxID=392414 RepID=A0ABQ2CXB4_9DEIO|nr:dockerin type I domain-containing protein [Deinococcus roseus]GGJ30357.1 hypothetical protein GCM10008938_15470 [Deinococcus roseus]
MKRPLAALLLSGLLLGAAWAQEPTDPNPQPNPGTGSPENPAPQPDPVTPDPATEAPKTEPNPETPATTPVTTPETEQPGKEQPETEKKIEPAPAAETTVPVIKIQVTVPEALRPMFTDALKVFSYERVPLQAEFTANADTQFLTETDIPFNPDAGSRTLTSGNKKFIWINTASALSQSLVWKVETARVLKLPDSILLPRDRILTEQDKQALKTQFASKGDLNGDDRVDLLDLIILAKNMGVENPPKGDLNQDGRVDDTDYNLFQQLYGK